MRPDKYNSESEQAPITRIDYNTSEAVTFGRTRQYRPLHVLEHAPAQITHAVVSVGLTELLALLKTFDFDDANARENFDKQVLQLQQRIVQVVQQVAQRVDKVIVVIPYCPPIETTDKNPYRLAAQIYRNSNGTYLATSIEHPNTCCW
jgi:hypothetical protein